MLAAVLAGLGVTSLSMAAAAVRPVGALLGTITMNTCIEAATVALAERDPMAARAAVRGVLGNPDAD
ncbi:hypothetical protein [Streptomyces sp. YIM S03343]